MRSRLALLAVVLSTIFAAAACSGDSAEPEATTSPTTQAPTTTTTQASTTTTSAAQELTIAVATVESSIDAFNAHDAEAFASYWVEGTAITYVQSEQVVVGAPEWAQWISNKQALGAQMSVSDCEVTNQTVRCFETYEDSSFSGKAGVVLQRPAEYTFDDDGKISYYTNFDQRGIHEYFAFDELFSRWLEDTDPAVFEEYYAPVFYKHVEEAWTLEGLTQLQPFVDEFIAQSDEYPLET